MDEILSAEQVQAERHTAVGQHVDTGRYHGLVYRNHKTPSGCDRWFETEREAGEFMNNEFPELKSLAIRSVQGREQ